MKIKLGFSTGTLYKHLKTKDALLAIRKAGIVGVELGFVKALDEDWLSNVVASELEEFEYVSMHAPKFEYDDNTASYSILQKIAQFHTSIRKLDTVVFHPDPIKNFSVLSKAGIPVAIENMDNRKPSFQNPFELIKILDKFPEFKVVLDVNHIFSNDSSMRLAEEFYRLLGDKIVQIHLSGYAGYHEPLFETEQQQIFKSIQNLKTPIIVESVLPPEDLDKEKNYILNLAKNISGS